MGANAKKHKAKSEKTNETRKPSEGSSFFYPMRRVDANGSDRRDGAPVVAEQRRQTVKEQHVGRGDAGAAALLPLAVGHPEPVEPVPAHTHTHETNPTRNTGLGDVGFGLVFWGVGSTKTSKMWSWWR